MIQKSRIALMGAFLCGTVSTPSMAETSLYGDIRFSYENFKNELMESSNHQRRSNMKDRASRIGINGGEDLGNGVNLIFHLEWGFNGMEGGNNGGDFWSRLAYIGLQNEQLGTIQIGRMHSPFADTLFVDSAEHRFIATRSFAVSRAFESQLAGGVFANRINFDGSHSTVPHPNNSAITDDRITTVGNFGYNLDRIGNTISYYSPNLSGFSLNAFIVMDDEMKHLQHKRNLDLYSFNMKYQHSSGFYGKIGYIAGTTSGKKAYTMLMSNQSDRRTSAIAAQLGYRTQQFSISAAYVDAKLKNVSQLDTKSNLYERRKDRAKGWDIGATYAFGDNYMTTLILTYGEAQYRGENFYQHDYASGHSSQSEWNQMKPKEKIISFGLQQRLSQRTLLWLEYERIKEGGSHTTLKNDRDVTKAYQHSHKFNGKNDLISIGIRHTF